MASIDITPSITAGFNAVGEFFGLLEKLSPEMNAWIAASIPAHEQHVMDRRIRKCKRICRKGHFGTEQISEQVDVDFSQVGDTDQHRADIVSILDFSLNQKPLPPHIVAVITK